MNRELIVNVNPTEISIALCEDKVLVELNKEQCQTGFSVGDIYLGKVRKIMPGLNAAFVNIGHEKDAFIHYLDLGSQFPSLQKLVASQQPGKRGMRVEGMKLEPPVEKTGKIEPTVLLDKKIENQISFLTQDRGHKYIKLVVSPYVAAFLRKGIWSLRRRWEWKYKLRLHVVEDQSLGIVEVHYHDDKDNDLINK